MLSLTILWHQHQPLYKVLDHPAPAGSHRQPWVRLHAIRDYYSMAALAAAHSDIHLTINLTPSLIWQLEDLIERGATDRARELTAKPADDLTDAEIEEVVTSFFDAHWHNQIFPHPRYKELFMQRQEGQPFSPQDLRDLQMWFNLAWFGQEFREGDVTLVTGEVASVRQFVEQDRGFSVDDIMAMLAEQDKIIRAILPIHRQLQEHGQIEIATTPFAHPILPLLIDTDRATIDRPGTAHPRRFRHPEDAELQVAMAIACYVRHFGQPPAGMWPAEGAVAQSVVPILARHGMRWMATDSGVLSRSGRWGYRADDPDVLCQPYRAEENGAAISVFFRDAALSNAIGFQYQAYEDHTQAAANFLQEIKERFAWRLPATSDRVLTLVLDGENAWGAYRKDARPFLHALYSLLEHDSDVRTVTFAEYLDGNPARAIPAHPLEMQTKVHDLFTGSWIDEPASAPGVDLGTWIGEPEENRAWVLLGQARDAIASAGVTPQAAPAVFEALIFAEGSDWFWWFGEDQDAERDDLFDDLFREHLRTIYRALGQDPPGELDGHIVPHAVVWSFIQPVARIQPGDRLRIRTNCPGMLTWWIDGGEIHEAELTPVGGVMAGVRRYQLTLDPAPLGAKELRFRFRCTHPGCPGGDICCSPHVRTVKIAAINDT